MAPPLPDVPKAVSVLLSFSDVNDLDFGVKMYFTYAGSNGTETDYSTTAAQLFADAAAALPAVMQSDTSIIGVTITDLSSVTGPRGIYTGAVPGTRTGTLLSAATVANFEYATAVRYRGGHFRNGFPFGVTADLQNNQRWSDTAVSDFESAQAAFMGDWLTDFWGSSGAVTQVGISYYSGFTNMPYGTPTKYRRVPTPRTTPLTYPVVSTTCATRLGTRRRRLGKSL